MPTVKSLFLVSSFLLTGAAIAQAPLGTISKVEGLVTVTDGATGGTLQAGSPITNGMRFIATSSGTATLQLNNGCSLTLLPGQAVTVLQSMSCQQLTAAVQQVGGTGVAAGAYGGSTGIAAAGLASGGLLQHNAARNNRSISSN